MTESKFWSDTVRPQLISFGKLKRVEDLIEKGTSDVIYCLKWGKEPARVGWVELKKLPAWPAFGTTTVKLPHYSVEQASFLQSWGRAGAGAFLLAQVSRDYLLWGWEQAHDVQRGMKKNEFIGTALVHAQGAFPTARILRCLTHI